MTFDVEICVWLPRSEVPQTELGVAGAIGWIACVAPDVTAKGDVCGVTYTLDLTADAETADWDEAA